MPVRRARGERFGLTVALAALLLSLAGRAQQAKPPAKSPDTFVMGAAISDPAVNTPTWTLAPMDKRLANPTSAQIQTIITRFAANEETFMAQLQHNYTYTESIIVQELSALGPDGQVEGTFRQANNVMFTPDGSREIVCTFCPQPTLVNLNLTEDDLVDMFNMNMYTVSADTLPQYNIAYLDHQPLDDVTAYVFRVEPKQIVKGHRYFDGVVYVEDQHDMIVKSIGRVVPNQYDKKGNPTNTFLPFTVWRKQVDGKYWFPVYTLMQGEVPSEDPTQPPLPMRMVIQFTNYKQFGVTSRIIAVQALPKKQDQPKAKEKKGGGGGGGQPR